MKVFFTEMDSPVGVLTLVADDQALLALLWDTEKPRRVQLPEMIKGSNTVLDLAVKQLSEYFAGERRDFELPLNPKGSEFQKKVWLELRKIPFGSLRTYGEIAAKIGQPKASRAVGAANGKNPLSIVVPCHRVIGSTGKLTGFAGGLDRKETLLKLEAQENR